MLVLLQWLFFCFLSQPSATEATIEAAADANLPEAADLYADEHLIFKHFFREPVILDDDAFYTTPEDPPLGREKRGLPYAGIPVPGQTVSSLDIMDLFTASCKPNTAQNDGFQPTDIVSKSLNLLSSQRGEQFAQLIYRNLFANMAVVDLQKLMGKWYKVLDSPTVHRDACSVSYFNMISNSTYLATFSVKEYYRENGPKGDIKSVHGFGTKSGPDAGEFQLNTGHDSDPCPYLLVRTGPLNRAGNYEYVIFAQMLKHPVMVYARDPLEFDKFYKQEVNAFLESNNFLNFLTRSYNMVTFLDFNDCENNYYLYL